MKKKIVLALLFMITTSSTVIAVPIIDQSQMTQNGSIAFWSDNRVAQTFTANNNGLLAQIDLWVGGSAGPNFRGIDSWHISIHEWNNNTTGNLLGVKDLIIDYSNGGIQIQETNIDLLSLNINVSSGTQYAMVFSNDRSYYGLIPNDPNYRNIGVAMNWTDNPYAGGSRWQSALSIGNMWQESASNDVMFRTYVDSAPVPEPTTMLLFGTGLAGLAAVGRRRRN